MMCEWSMVSKQLRRAHFVIGQCDEGSGNGVSKMAGDSGHFGNMPGVQLE
jgi:hypothetical protein